MKATLFFLFQRSLLTKRNSLIWKIAVKEHGVSSLNIRLGQVLLSGDDES